MQTPSPNARTSNPLTTDDGLWSKCARLSSIVHCLLTIVHCQSTIDQKKAGPPGPAIFSNNSKFMLSLSWP